MHSRIEELLTKLINGDTVSFKPLTRNEQYLKACCNKSGTNELPEPMSRIEALLYRLAEEISKGGGTAGGRIRDLIVANGLSCYEIFSNISVVSFNDVLAYEDTSSVTDMSSMFYNCSNLTTVPVFDTRSVTNMTSMFDSCSNLTTVPLFDTRSVTSMYNMFYNCSNLTTVPLFDTRSVTSMGSMFSSCSNLTTVPLFDTRSVTSMGSMFSSCSNLTTVPLFDTRSVTNMGSMFSSCSNLTTVPLFDTRSVTNMGTMFRNCKQLTECWFRNIKANLTVGSGTTYGHLLTLESLKHLIQELRNTGTSKTLTVGSANLTKLANVYVKTISITDEMRAEDDLIDEKLPFVVCESTDDGAMLITDYALAKKWTIK